jgi:Topoisomerase 6 subunit A/Spo11, Toprim domain
MKNTLGEVIQNGLKKVTRDFTRAKKQAYGRREDRISQWQIDKWKNQNTERQLKAAAYEAIPQAYMAASGNRRFPANVRQIFYQVRPLVIAATGGNIWKNSATFTQNVFQDYLRDNPEETSDWDIVYDARGHFSEPHVQKQIGCGTLEVRSYTNSWENAPDPSIEIDETFPTNGPKNRYKFALFIEKEGFDALLDRARIAQRYDLAIFSTKGMPVTAARRLVEKLSEAGVTILIAHDFDIAGISIAHWLWHDNDRYEFQHQPRVIDLGLRPADVKKLDLQSEEQVHRQLKDPTEKFWDWDDDPVSDEEADFLRGEYSYQKGGWVGQRVELNAMTSAQFIGWLEDKFRKAGVQKVVPNRETLALAWNRAKSIAKAREIIEQEEADHVAAPKDLEQKVRAMLKRHHELSWDQALARIAERETNQ